MTYFTNYLQKSFLSSLFCCLFIFKLEGQQVTLAQSDLIDKPQHSQLSNIIVSDEDGFFLEHDIYNGNKINGRLEKHDYSFNILKEQEFAYELDGKSLKYASSFYFHNKLFTVSTLYDNKEKENRYYLIETDPSTLKPIGIPIEYNSLFKNLNESYKPHSYILSENGQMIAFIGKPGYIIKSGGFNEIPKPMETSNGASKGSVVVLDQMMEKKWELNYSFPNNGESYKFESVNLDDLGNFYVLGILYDKGAKNSGGKNGSNYHYVITAITDNGKTSKEYHISLGEKFITSCAITLTSEGQVKCTGFYSYKKDNLIKGTFLTTIDPKTQLIVTNYNGDLPAKFLKLFMSENKLESGAELADYTLKDIIKRENDEVTLILEKSFENSSIVKNPTTGVTSEQTIYHRDEIVLITLSGDNSVLWYVVIPKKQASAEYRYLSYGLHINGEMIYLIYNDNEKNQNEDNVEKLNTYIGKNAVTTLITINGNGDLVKTTLFTEDEKQVAFIPIFFKQISSTESLIYSENDEQYRIGRLVFN